MRLFSFIACILFSLALKATHNRAGEITFKHIEGYTYEFTISTYTYRLSAANELRNNLLIEWGDGEVDLIPRINIEFLDNFYQFNTYVAVHTFPGPGKYEILMEDPMRNLGVNNIPNSVNTFFSIKTSILITANTGSNSTPELLNPPIDQAARGHLFIHNPAAYDSDGDSLSYKLTTCTGADGVEIDGYILPAATDTLYVDPISGNLIWQTPADTGVYNIAIFVEEWRNNVRISRIARDMQIDVFETENNPPENLNLKDYCLIAGDSLQFKVVSTDPDGDPVVISMNGGPFEVDTPAVFIIDSVIANSTYGTFIWKTNCLHPRKHPYSVVLKSSDVTSDDINLVNISNINIRVLHTAPELIDLKPGVDSINIIWNASTCGIAKGYHIYRKIGSYNYTPDSCELGVPDYTGFMRIGSTYSHTDTIFKDDNSGLGLVPGYDYCYMVTAFYDDGAESQASSEICTTLVSGVPAMIKVSVEENDEKFGKIELAWAKPLGVDTIYDTTFRYEVFRKAPNTEEFISIGAFVSPDLNDTVFVDSLINTLEFPYYYNVRLYYQSGSDWILIPGSETASSTYLSIYPEDNILNVEVLKRAPWLNRQFVYNKLNETTQQFDSVYSDSINLFVDRNLENLKEYTYNVITTSQRPINDKIYTTQNKSHLNSGIPIDTVPPCSPNLNVTSQCELSNNLLQWTFSSDDCFNNEMIYYKIYYKEEFAQDFLLIDSILDINIYSYTHLPTGRLAGCYAVTAVDSFYNESDTIPVCVDSCEYYKLPNVFTPNNDGNHDFFIAENLGGFIKQVDMKIFNRYGQLVFETNDPYIRWNARHFSSNRLVSTGVYYYVCDVYEPRINGVQIITLTGFIHVYSGDDNAIILPE